MAFAGTWTYDPTERAMVLTDVTVDVSTDDGPLSFQGSGGYQWLDREGTYTLEEVLEEVDSIIAHAKPKA